MVLQERTIKPMFCRPKLLNHKVPAYCSSASGKNDWKRKRRKKRKTKRKPGASRKKRERNLGKNYP